MDFILIIIYKYIKYIKFLFIYIFKDNYTVNNLEIKITSILIIVNYIVLSLIKALFVLQTISLNFTIKYILTRSYLECFPYKLIVKLEK